MNNIPSLAALPEYRRTSAQVLQLLHVRESVGLSTAQVRRRIGRHGLNELRTQKRGRLLKLFMERFSETLIIILICAAAASMILGNIHDAVIIAIAIAIDVVLSFFQVLRTERTLARMKIYGQDTCTVMRNGETSVVPTSHLVPGDIIELQAGDTVPADSRLLHVRHLTVRESILTGESNDIEKLATVLHTRTPIHSQKNIVFAGTTITSGTGQAVVIKTGSRTEFGKITNMLRDQQPPSSPLRRELQKRGVQIGSIIIALVAALVIIGLAQGSSMSETSRTAITLIVSAIPEDLTMILTITLAVGVARILRKGGMVRRLSSGETLGATTVICTDKTGTLTEGIMRPKNFILLQGDSIQTKADIHDEYQRLAITALALTNDAHRRAPNKKEYIGADTERTALEFAESLEFEKAILLKTWKIRDTLPFDTRWKYRCALVDHPTQSHSVLFVVGAPDILIEKSSYSLNTLRHKVPLTSGKRYRILRKIEDLASEGNRLIAVCVRRNLVQSEITHDDVQRLLFLGILLIEDPVRLDISEAILDAQSAGVSIKLVTGDHAGTARATAIRVGIPANNDLVCRGDQIQLMTDRELDQQIESTNVFARIEPLDKQRIVRALQKRGHIVAMTGDGINDAVALKTSDVGIAMGSGSDVAKDASDVILIDDSFRTIVETIREGRVIRDNIRKVIAFLIATNAAEVAVFFVSVLANLPLPLLPAQILWINLVTDGTSDIALSLEPPEKDIMRRKPESPDTPIIGTALTSDIIFSGIVMTASTSTLYWYLYSYGGADLTYARTMTFTFLSVASLLSVWSFRSLRHRVTRHGLWKNKWVILSTCFSFSLQLLAIYATSFQRFFNTVPLKASDWLIIGVLGIATALVIDIRKIILPRMSRSSFEGVSIERNVRTV